MLINSDKELKVKNLTDGTITFEKVLKNVKRKAYDIRVIDKHFFMHDSHTGALIYHLVM